MSIKAASTSGPEVLHPGARGHLESVVLRLWQSNFVSPEMIPLNVYCRQQSFRGHTEKSLSQTDSWMDRPKEGGREGGRGVGELRRGPERRERGEEAMHIGRSESPCEGGSHRSTGRRFHGYVYVGPSAPQTHETDRFISPRPACV